MGRFVWWVAALGLSVVVVAGCNDVKLSAAPDETPAPDASPTPVPCKFYAVDRESNLWLIDPDVTGAELVGPTGIERLTDLAINEDAEMLAITRTDIYRIAPDTGQATSVREAAFDDQVAADAVLADEIILGGTNELTIFDLPSGSMHDIATLPGGYEFAGDIAVQDERTVFVTAHQSSSNDSHLFEFDLVTGAVSDRGSLGASRVFGLDFACDGRLFGLIEATPPLIIEIDPEDATTSPIGTAPGPTSLWGAAGPAGG